MPIQDGHVRRWIESLPLYSIAKTWGLSVEAFNGCPESLKGSFSPRGGIALGVKNLLVWAHELVHAADHRVHRCLGERWEEEVVAGLGGGALLISIGLPERADLGGCYVHIQKHVADRGKTVLEACELHRQRTAIGLDAILQAKGQIREDQQ